MDSWEMVTSGQFIEGIIAVYTNVMGSFFYGLIIFLALILIYIKTENIGTVGIVGLLIAGSILIYMPPQIHALAVFLLALSITAIIYKAFVR